MSRRGLLSRAAAAFASITLGAAAATVASGIRAPSARAGLGGPNDNVAIKTGGRYKTTLHSRLENLTNNTPVFGIYGQKGGGPLIWSGDSYAIDASGVHDRAVHAKSTDSTGVPGESTSRWGVYVAMQGRNELGQAWLSASLCEASAVRP